MSIERAGSMVVVFFFLAAFAAASPALSQTEACLEQSATGHLELIGTVPNVHLGRHIIYSFRRRGRISVVLATRHPAPHAREPSKVSRGPLGGAAAH